MKEVIVMTDDLFRTPSYQKSHNELLQNYNKSIDSFIEHRKKEAEEALRRYDEHLEATKNSRASVIMGSFGDKVTEFSISAKDSPVMVINPVFNYDKASVILEAIKGKFNDLSFNSEFGDNAELVKRLLNEALKLVKDKDDPTLIQNSLAIVSDAIRGSSGVIASGIILLLGRLSLEKRSISSSLTEKIIPDNL